MNLLLWLVCLVSSCELICGGSASSVSSNNGNVDLRMFFSLNQALDYFRNQSEDPLAEKILLAFENSCVAMHDSPVPQRRRPFVVIEGNHRQSRNVVGLRLARMMRGRYLVHPAHCLQHVADELPRGTLFRRAFYVLSMYALSIEARFHLSLGRSVVVNGYWWDMLFFALVQAYPSATLPNSSHQMVEFPKDLFQPDLVFYLDLPDNLYYRQATTRSPLSWKPRVLQLYRELQCRGFPLVVRQLTNDLRSTTDFVYDTVVANLTGHRDVWYAAKTTDFHYHDNT